MRRLLPFLAFLILMAPSAASAQDAVLGLLRRLLGPNVEVGEISGNIAARPIVRDIRLRDAEGVWLEIDEVAFDWSPASLFRRQVDINNVTATTVRVLRPPRYGAEETEAETTPLPPARPAQPSPGDPPPTADVPGERPFSEAIVLPSFPVELDLGQVAVERLELAEPILGEPAVVRLDGRIVLERAGSGAELRLHAERLDRPGIFDVSVDAVPAEDRLEVTAQVEEPQGGLIARALNLPGHPPVTLNASGNGPFSNWDGTIDMRAGTASIEADVRLRRPPEAAGGTIFALEGRGDAGDLAPESWTRYASPRVEFDIAGQVGPEGWFELAPGSRIRTDIATAEVAGTVDREAGELDLRLVVEALPPARELTPQFDWAALAGEITVEGTFEDPDLTARLTIAQPSAAAFEVAASSAVLSVVIEPESATRYRVGVAGTLEGATAPGIPLTQPRDIVLDVVAVPSLDDALVDIRTAALRTDGAIATVVGAVGFDGAVDIAYTLESPQLAELLQPGEIPIGGAVEISGTVVGEAGALPRVTLDGAVRGLDTPYDALDRLLAGRATLAATLTPQSDGGLVFDVDASGAAARLSAAGSLSGGRLATDLALDLPELRVLEGMDLTGSARLDGRIEGTPEALAVRASVTGRNVVAAGRSLGAPSLRLDLSGLPDAPRGTVVLEMSPEGVPLRLASGIALAGDRLTLADLELDAGPNRLAGDLRVDLARRIAEGRLDGRLGDLAVLTPLAGTELAGSADVALGLGRTGGGLQTVDLTVSGRGLVYGDNVVETLDATAQGTMAALDVRARAVMPFGEMAFAGEMSRRGDRTRVALAEARAVVEGEELRLLQPAVLTRTRDGIVVEGLRLATGDASVAADLTASSRTLDGTVVIRNFPLELLRVVGVQTALGGRLEADLALSGTPDNPAATARLALEDVLIGPSAARDLFRIDGAADAVWRDGRLTLDGRVRSERPGLDLNATASLPLVMRRAPLSFDMPPDAPAEARLEGQVILDRFSDLAAASGNEFGGEATLDVLITGLVGDPAVSGTVALAGGHYRNLRAGIVLTGVEGRIVGEGNRWRLDGVRAGTPEGGPLFAAGTVALPSLGRPEFDIQLTGDAARLTETDIATLFGSPDLRLVGPLRELQLTGSLNISEAEIRIPRGFPPRVVELDYIYVMNGVPVPTEEEMEAADDEPPAAPLRLDIAVVGNNRIFVRGRGLDAEFGGRVTIGGTTAEPDIAGGFDLLRGTFDLLGNRLIFDRGRIELLPGGGFNPVLDLVATTSLTDATVQVAVTGPPDDIDLRLESDPPLPEDEALARLLFGKATVSLTAVEAIQLANAAATLSGFGGGGGIFGQVRDTLGLTRLEVVGDAAESGGLGVAAGAYLSDRVYVEVEQGFSGQTEVGVQVEVTDRITVETSFGPETGTRVGVSVEWEY